MYLIHPGILSMYEFLLFKNNNILVIYVMLDSDNHF